MTAVRSLVFNIVFFGSLAFYLSWMWLALPFPRMVMQRIVRSWGRLVMAAMRLILGLRYEIRGRENLPPGGAIVASKHQSAWDTIVFYQLLDDPAYVLKIELMQIPLWGWYARKSKSIAVDRKGGAAALKRMMRDTRVALDEGRAVIIFPEGTRTAPDATQPYHSGIAAIYRDSDHPVVPVALNSGLFWGRRRFNKYGGVITLEFLPAIAPGMDRKDFLRTLQQRIDAASARLVAEGRRVFPHLPANGDGEAARAAD